MKSCNRMKKQTTNQRLHQSTENLINYMIKTMKLRSHRIFKNNFGKPITLIFRMKEEEESYKNFKTQKMNQQLILENFSGSFKHYPLSFGSIVMRSNANRRE